ncbi:TPA: transcriptional regulator [Escherichia coli]|uniref:Transcriptional regulator n=1 Tax=Escherichia coli TaxID=562 RepID=A0A895NV04_ECOLX|nr:transcriptional regulator [Escherichia coli]MCV8380777.1 transcriptional regulator [Escherichia coli]MCV8974044.1 transcriptional regulator [Escherichia coli]MDN1911960.1 transcriptional regulator [Escherichia coli]QRZ95237.1 transcriptional regulator [Escherichia coli]SPW89853.1 putative transcriptional regulator [Escherichia coli]
MKARIGIIPEKVLRQRLIEIAKGERKPQPDEPRVWFSSINAAGQALSNENISLLRLMDEEKPQTMTELAELSGRKLSNLSVTLKMLSSYGFVSLEKKGNTVHPKALFTDFEIIVDPSVGSVHRAA